MSNAQTHKKSLKSVASNRILTGPALLNDMKKYHGKVAQSSASARDFLVRLGVMTVDGKTKKLIRG